MLNKIWNDKNKSPRAEQIIDQLFDTPFLRTSFLHKKLGVTYPTAPSDINCLIKHGIVKRNEELKPKTYYSPEILSVAYGDISE